jgi:hypothetical protein
MTMFAPPNASRTYTNPGDTLEPMTRYIVTCVSFEDQGVSIFEKDKAKPDAEHSILWKWNVHNNDGTPVLDDDQLWEFWEWTSNRTGMRQDGTPSACRARLQALVGRELSDNEVTHFISDQGNLDKLPGRRAYATFHKRKGKNREGEDVLKPAIQSIMPIKPKQEAAALPPQVIAAPAVPAAEQAIPFDPPTAVAADQPLL